MSDDDKTVDGFDQSELQAPAPGETPPGLPGLPDVEVDADPADFEPGGSDLVVQQPHEVHLRLDKHDEKQIMEEMQQRVLDVTLYDFESGGKRQVDLSYNGVREVVHLMNRTGKVRLGVMPDSMQQETVAYGDADEPHYRVIIWARDEVTGETYPGTSMEPFKMKVGSSKRDDPFAFTKALNKAARNALKQFIPEQLRQVLIAQYLKQPERVRVVQAGEAAATAAALPPPLTTPEAEELKGRVRTLYAELGEVNPESRALFTPGQFNVMLRRAEHDMKALGEVEADMAERVEKAKG